MSASENVPVRAVLYGGSGAVALALATVHPLGVLLGGALWGLLAPTVRRGVAYGVGFGALALAVFAAGLAADGALAAFIATGPLAVLPVAVALVFGGVGGLARGLR